MSKKLFTSRDIKELSKSKQIRYIDQKTVSFKPEFKEYAYNELLKGRKMKDIMRDKGINPEILGDARVNSFTQRIRFIGEYGSFEDGRRAGMSHSVKLKKDT